MTQRLLMLRHLGLAALLTVVLGTGVALRPAAAANPFTARYAGTFTLTNCPLLGVLRTACVMHLNGTGSATALGTSRETGTLTANLNLLPTECGAISGNETLTSVQNPANSVTAEVRGQICSPLLGGLLGGRAPYHMQYTIISGTGAFSSASGQGRISGQARFDFVAGQGVYADQWQGSLSS
jgi:hypothetical protein